MAFKTMQGKQNVARDSTPLVPSPRIHTHKAATPDSAHIWMGTTFPLPSDWLTLTKLQGQPTVHYPFLLVQTVD